MTTCKQILPPNWTATFSIVAADPSAGQVGVAVQSKVLAVGAIVPWTRAGVGAVATQSFALARYGPELLEKLEGGAQPWTRRWPAIRWPPGGRSGSCTRTGRQKTLKVWLLK